MNRDLSIIEKAAAGVMPEGGDLDRLAAFTDLDALMALAASMRDARFGDLITHSRNVFIPLTKLCRDSCHYCTFARPPRKGEPCYLTPEEVLAIAEAGKRTGCTEALFTLGDRPEARYRVAKDELASLGCRSTIDYVETMARRVLNETGLLPHLNPGVMSRREIERLRSVSVSMGLMLETSSERLSAKGGPHHGSPDKQPTARIATIDVAGEARVPFTSGILIGIGETRRERVESILALRALNERHGHLQEVIVQNFLAKPGTRMEGASEPAFEELLWTVAVARILLGSNVSIQAPPNLNPGRLVRLIGAGIDDWGGVSPVTEDHVNPEAPWPSLQLLEAETAKAGKLLVERLAVYPRYLAASETWLDAAVRPHALRAVDSEGFVRPERWTPGAATEIPRQLASDIALGTALISPARRAIDSAIDRALTGQELSETEIVRLFEARGEAAQTVCKSADALRRAVKGDVVGYVVNRNISYTNICSYRCQFCAFSKGKLSENLRGKPYDFSLEEIARHAEEAWARGGTEVCIQGGIHPSYTGQHYLDILQAVKSAVPGIHVHAFSPLEIHQGAKTLGVDLTDFLHALKDAGLGSLPGTAAEILDDEIRRVICPDKVTTAEWLNVVGTAHGIGIRSTATIMFGHIERPVHWARHLLNIRRLQEKTGGFSEFVPLPFVAAESPIYLKGRARRGPTYRESILMHAVARLALHPLIGNIQASWVKMGPDGIQACLEAGANDFGGTLMNESISRAAGAAHGQELCPDAIEHSIRGLGRTPRQRTTLYEDAPEERRAAARAHYWPEGAPPPAPTPQPAELV